MPRTARAAVGGYCYHVLNRGNGRLTVFHGEDDYASFVALLRTACARVPMRVLAYCLVPNHFHLVLWPEGDNDLARWMHWVLTSHVARYRKRYRTSGHVWQGRFKAFPIQEDEHLVTVLRYGERNPLRANLVARAEDWRWSSLGPLQLPARMPWLHPGPVPRGTTWVEQVNLPQTDAELERLRRSVARGTPYGGEPWMHETVDRLGLEFTLRPAVGGRPRKEGVDGTFDWAAGVSGQNLECPGSSLRNYGIDPFYSRENLLWAPNWGHPNQMSIDSLAELRMAVKLGGARDQIRQNIVDTLQKLGRDYLRGRWRLPET